MTSIPVSHTPQRQLPGDLAIWFFILAELTVFALLFIVFTVARINEPEVFIAGQATVHPVAGLINTLALITSSYLVAVGVWKAEQGEFRQCGYAFCGAMGVALIYVGTKGWEYQQLIAAGYNLSTNFYYTLYFLITFFHFMHVLLGMIILGFIARKSMQGQYLAGELAGIESGAVYWHMVDMVWVVLFPLVYVIH
ncbi:MAG: cytochrome c oxidase subunit 3 family protein [Hahellaceae bacterium]|nr:cytochrome c oxidase subunit 3 family protein [Hahellaceae bacterium]MCP5169730.1 cytochrome c oxidase subunit 3 family protein [Hahellaceae bacterium]